MASITISAQLNDRAIQQSATNIKKTIGAVLDDLGKKADELTKKIAAIGGGVGGGTGGGGGRPGRNGEADLIRLAQAQARLQATTGNLAAAQNTLKVATQGVSQQTVTFFNAQTQLANVNNKIAQQSASQSTFWRRYSSTIREAGESVQNVGYALTSAGRFILDFGRSAVTSAINIDKQVNTIKALTGSAAAAEARFKSLFSLAQRTPGLTTQLATTLDAQLRLAGTSEQSIDRVLPALGRLNAVSPIQDVTKFTQNLIQLATQNFERQDLKELVGNSPIAGLLIKSIFNVDSPINSAAIKESARKFGINSVETLFNAIAAEAARNPALANVTESLGTQFDKLQDRIAVALRPLGKAIIDAILPAVNALVPVIETISNAFASLPQGLQSTVVILGLLAGAIGPVVIGMGALIQATGAVLNLQTVIAALSTGVAANTAVLTTLAPTAKVAGAAVLSLEAQLAAAGTTIGTTAAGFSLLNPIVLGIVAVLGIAAFAWANYESAQSKALDVAKNQLPVTAYETQQIKASLEALQAKSVSTEALGRAITFLNPAEQVYVETLGNQAEKIQRVNDALREKQQIQQSLLEVQVATTVRGLIPQTAQFVEQQKTIDSLAKQYAVASVAVREYGNSQVLTVDASGAVITTGSLVRGNLAEVGNALLEARKRAGELASEVSPLVKALLETGKGADGARQLLDRLAASGTLTSTEATAAKNALAAFAAQAANSGDAASKAAVQVFNLANAIQEAGIAGAKSDLRKRVENAVTSAGGNVKQAIESLTKGGVTKQAVTELDGLQKKVDGVLDSLGLGDKPKARAQRPVTEGSVIERVTREVKKLRIEIDGLERGGGKLFDLEFQKNELEQTKQQLNEILRLRRELGINQGADTPQTQADREAELRQLNLDKRTREEILKLAEQQAEYEAKITIELAKRQSQSPTAEQRAALALAQESNKLRDDAIEIDSKWLLLQGLLFTSQNRVQEKTRQATDSLLVDAQSRILATQEEIKVLEALAEARSGDGVRLQEERAALLDAQKQRLLSEQSASDEILAINARLTAGLINEEIAIGLFRARASEQRVNDERTTVANIRDLESQIEKLRSGDGLEASLNRSFEARRRSEQQVLDTLIALRAEDVVNLAATEDYKRTIVERAELSRRTAARQTKDEILLLEEEIAHAGEDSALRRQKVFLESVRDIQKAQEDAQDSIIRSQVQIANQTVFNADRANARVLEFIAAQKDASTIIADSRISLIQTAFDGVDSVIGKLTQRLGVFKGFLQEILSGFAKLLLSRAFTALFGLGNVQGAGSGGNLLSGLTGLLNGGGGGNTNGGGGGGGIGNFLGGLLNGGGGRTNGGGFNLAGLIGPGGTATFNNSTGSGNALSRILGIGGSSGGGGANNIFGRILGLGDTPSAAPSITLPRLPNVPIPPIGGGGTTTGTGGILSRISGFGSRLFGGAGGALLPLLGVGLGAGVGGESGLGRILGGIGGGAVGLGLSYGASVFGALGGGFGALGPAALAALGPIALIGAPLLIGALLLGKAKQRRKDESTSGDYLQQAVDAIRSLKRDVNADRVVGERQARDVFNDDILKTFIDQINTIKTKSVRESRLKNQTRDLKALFEKEVIPAIALQSQRKIVNSRLVPEFATGGYGTSEGLAYLHAGEAILNRRQQAALVSRTNPAIFQQIGVPNAPKSFNNGSPVFEAGGFMPQTSGNSGQPINLNVTLTVSEQFAEELLSVGASTTNGRQVIVNSVRVSDVKRR